MAKIKTKAQLVPMSESTMGTLHPSMGTYDPIMNTMTPSGWNYQMENPNMVETENAATSEDTGGDSMSNPMLNISMGNTDNGASSTGDVGGAKL